LDGSDYVRFDGIDVATSLQGIEYGYYLRKANTDDGCKYVTIQNCNIDMTKGTSSYVVGIYSSNNDSNSTTSSATGITLTSTGGRHENVTIINNSVESVFVGILIRGHNDATAPYDYYDQNFTVGMNGAGNTIANFGGNASATCYGIYVIYHDGQRIVGNSVNNTVSPFTATGYGIFNSTSYNSDITIDSNIVEVLSDATGSSMYGIYVSPGTNGTDNTVSISNNNVSDCVRTLATTGAFTAIQHSSTTTKYINISNNIVADNSLSGTGAFTGIDAGGGTTPGSKITMNQNYVIRNEKTGTHGNMYCIRASGDTVELTYNTVDSNSLSATSGASACYMYGYYNLGSPKSESIYGNTFSHLFIDGSNTSTSSRNYGIYTYTVSSATKNIYSNSIYDLRGVSGEVFGIRTQLGSDVRIYKNSISDLTNNVNNTTAAVVTGVTIASGTTYVYNNYIHSLQAPNSESTDAIRGINSTSTTTNSTIGIYYNTIYLDATSVGANFGTTGIYHMYNGTATTAALDMHNNVVVNMSIPAGTGSVTAFRRSSATDLNNFSDGNNNCFYSGTPGPGNLIFTDGTNMLQTLADYKTHVSPREMQSVTELPPFISAPNDLHINTATATLLESGGAPVSTPISIGDDYYGTSRSATTPDIGAEEFVGTPAGDLFPPLITVTPLNNTTLLGPRTLTASITDASGVPTSGIGLPVLYWSINNSAGPFTPATGTHTGGSNYDFTISGVVATGDTVYYYVAAQDMAGTPNVTTEPLTGSGGYSANPPAASVPPSSPFSYVIVTGMSSTVNVGSGETYTSLTGDDSQGLFKAINDNVVTGNLTVLITSDLTESGDVALNETMEEAMYTITIKSSADVNRTISGTVSGGLIRINGADDVMFDGRGSSGGRYLTFVNNSTSANSTVFQIISNGAGAGSEDVTIRNCNITGGSTTVTSVFGIFAGGPTVSTTGEGEDNDNLTIDSNVISNVYYGIYAVGTSTNPNDSLEVTNNTITGAGFTGLFAGYSEDALITLNEISNIVNASTAQVNGMEFSDGFNNSEVSRNKIYNIEHSATNFRAGKGLVFDIGGSYGNIKVVNNVIYGLKGHGSSSPSNNSWGIMINSGSLYEVYYNSIHISDNRTTTSSTDRHGCIYVASGTSSLYLVNNVFSVTADPGNISSGYMYSIYSLAPNTAYTSINYNDYYASGTRAVLGYIGGSDQSTLASWQTATGQDVNSLASDPDFYSDVDLRPSTSSPLLLAGVNLPGYTVDYLGVSRHATTPTIGAYEDGVAPPSLDVGISSIIAPGSGQIVDRSGSDVSAYLKNFGTGAASGIDVYFKLDSNPAVGPVSVAGPLAPGDSILVTFTGANQLSSPSDGVGTVKVYPSLAGDGNALNDTSSVIVVLVNPLSVPYFEEFTTPAFYTSSGTANIWIYATGVNPAGTAADQMAKANFYGVSSGYQYLRTPIIDLTGTSNPILSFYVTYRSYTGQDDGLEVRVSTDGGMTYDAPLLDKSYSSVPSLATLPNDNTSPYTPGAATDWRHEVLDLSAYAGQKIVIGFNAITAYGNNMWIDNIDVTNSANVSIIPVAATGAYGDLSTDSAQVIFTALRPGLGGGTTPQLDGKISEIVRPEGTIIGELKFADENSPTLKVERNKKGKGNNPGISPDASTGTLVISHFTDFPLNNTFAPNVSATTFNGAIYTPDVISNRYWEISFSGDDYVSEATYDIVLDIRGQLGVVTYDSLYIVKRVDQSGPWVCLSTITEYESGVPVRLRANGISGFSQFGIAAADGTLPVDLIEFNATVDRNNVMLSWSTAWEENNMKFDVQRRPAETEASWQTVGSVKGSGTVHEQRNYSYHDKRLVTGKYEYRLVQVDFDGNITADHNLGSVVEVGIPTEFALSQNYPNPFNPSTKIDFQIPVEGMTKLVIFDLSGREVATLVNETLMPGYYTYDFNASTLASGVYFYRLVSKDNIQTKRMVLIK